MHVIFNELSPQQQAFADRALQICFAPKNPLTSWITRVEPRQTVREMWYLIYKRRFDKQEIDLVLNGVCVRAAYKRWEKNGRLPQGAETVLDQTQAHAFLQSCLYGE